MVTTEENIMMTKESPLIDKMRQGHQIRTGHELVAHLESEDGELWRVVRECC